MTGKVRSPVSMSTLTMVCWFKIHRMKCAIVHYLEIKSQCHFRTIKNICLCSRIRLLGTAGRHIGKFPRFTSEIRNTWSSWSLSVRSSSVAGYAPRVDYGISSELVYSVACLICPLVMV